MSLFRDVGTLIVSHMDPAPEFLGIEGGHAIQILLVVGLVLPLCLLKDIRSVQQPCLLVLIPVGVGSRVT